MKNKLYQLMLFFAVATITLLGCSKDPLDITPDGRMTTEEVFKSQDLTEAYLNTAYEYIRKYGTGYHYYTFLSSYTDDGTDSQVPTDSWMQLHQWNQGNFSASEPPFMAGSTVGRRNDRDFWGTNYGGIRKTNVFLANVNEGNVPIPSLRGRYIAEAKILRAHYYFDLIKNFGGVPIIDKDITREIDHAQIKRASFDECVKFIVKDCDEAIAEPALPFRTVEVPEQGRMTKAVAYFIKASALLFNASPLWNPENSAVKWQAATAAAKQAVDALASNGYQLFNDYEGFFITRPDKSGNPTDKETILEAIDTWGYQGQEYRSFGSIAYLMQMIPTFPSEKPGNCPSQELIDSYEMADGSIPILGYSDADHLNPIINPASGYDDQNPYVKRDPRFYKTVWYNGAYFGVVSDKPVYIESFLGGKHGISGIKQRSPTGYYTRKYIDPKMRNNSSSKTLWRIYRLGELYLTLAEAENEANGPTAIAYNAVNTVRTRAGMPNLPAGLTKEQFRDRIRRERRVEMAIEENRFYDIRRWNIMTEVSKVKTGMEWTKKEDGTLKNRRIVSVRPKNYDAKWLLLPIPLGETIRMPLVQQNPGWE